jgi:hypothetical protein
MKIKHITCWINGVQMSGTPTQIIKVLDGNALAAFCYVLEDLQKDMYSGSIVTGLTMVYQGINVQITAS